MYANMAKKRKSRIDPVIRIRIVQIRASNSENPPSIDAILDCLEKEGFDRLPSRTTVAAIIREWENLPEEIRWRDLPFQWNRLEVARVPWEASGWLLTCARALEVLKIRSFQSTQGSHELWNSVFTNRRATWCWRVHLAAPDLDEIHVLALAFQYSDAEQANDLLPSQAYPSVEGTDGWLLYRPDMDEASGATYDTALELKLVPPADIGLKDFLQAEGPRVLALPDELQIEAGIMLGFAVIRGKLFEKRGSHEGSQPREGGRHEREHGQTEQGKLEHHSTPRPGRQRQ